MSFAHVHGLTIDKSTFNDIQGDYRCSAITPGERGMDQLCIGGPKPLNS